MGFDFTAPVDLDSEAYLQEYGRQRRIWLAGKAGFDSVTDDEGVTTLVEREKVEKGRGVTILEPKARIGDDELGIAPRKVYRAAVALGLRVSCWKIVADVEPVLYLNDSKTTDAVAGDVLYEGFIARHYVVEARLPEQPMGFQAHYIGKGQDGTSAPFDSARVRDPYGIPVENWVDYTKDAIIAKEYGWSEERRVQEGMAMNRRINDGSDRLEFIRYFFQGGDFTRWLDDYLAVKGLKTITPNRKPKQTAEEKAAETTSTMLAGGEWNG